MQIPTRRQELLRKYEKGLFHTKDLPKHERLYGFYLLLRPILGWLKEELIKKGLEPDEAESELYLYSSKLFNEFNTSRSSIIPYLEKAIPWAASKLLRTKKEAKITYQEEEYFLDEEFYWDPIKILIEDRYVGKMFTRSEKSVISRILSEDKDLVPNLLVGRKTVYTYLGDIKEVLSKWRNL